MLKPADFFRAVLNKGVRPSDATLTLCPGAARELDKVGVGNHTYLVLRGAKRHEVVRYDHTDNYADRRYPDTITVVRDVQSLGPQTFGAGDCIEHAWFAQSIKEWINQELPV